MGGNSVAQFCEFRTKVVKPCEGVGFDTFGHFHSEIKIKGRYSYRIERHLYVCYGSEIPFVVFVTEFSGFDLEFSYINSFRDVMKMEEELLTYMLGEVKRQYGDQIEQTFGLPVVVPTTPFPVMKLTDLYDELEREFGYVCPEAERGDLTTEAERLSYDLVKKKFNHEFLFVTDYSAEKRAFYHMRDENGVPQGYDLIWRGTEITTGAQREHRYEQLKQQAEEKGLAEDVKFYLEFFKYGCPPHGGFGIGVDRLTMLLVGLHINEAMFLFRSPKRLTP